MGEGVGIRGLRGRHRHRNSLPATPNVVALGLARRLMELLAIILFWGLLWGVVCVLIAQRKDNSAEGAFCWGFFLGLIGVLVVALAKPAPPPVPPGLVSVTCPRCNAVQNIPLGPKYFDCWQCHLKTAAPPLPPPDPRAVPVTCPKCKVGLTVVPRPKHPTFECPDCGAIGQMPIWT